MTSFKVFFKAFFTTTIVGLLCNCSYGQMHIGQDTLYGNEWLEQGKDYYRFDVSEDAVYRIPGSALTALGFPLASVPASQFRLYRMGKEISILTSTDSIFSELDHITFYGEKMKGELDKHLYINPAQDVLNPEYSFINDTISYFLTWGPNASANRLKKATSADPNTYPIATDQTSNIKYTYQNYQKPVAGISIESRFEASQGYGSQSANTFSQNISLPGFNANGDSIRLHIKIGSKDYFKTHNIEVKWNSQNICNFSFASPIVVDTVLMLPATLYSGPSSLSFNEVVDVASFFILGMIEIDYPRLADGLGSNRLNINTLSSNEYKQLKITNFDHSLTQPIAIDTKNNLYQSVLLSGSDLWLTLPSDNINNNWRIVNPSQIRLLTNARIVQFSDWSDQSADYFIISHPTLRDDGKGNDLVQEYANYRSGPSGGSHKVLTIDINEIYDRFAYGNRRHFIAIRNFSNYVAAKWPNAKYLFLIGKGREFLYVRDNGNLKNTANASFYIPTYGLPGSDNLLAMNAFSNKSIISIGRIAAQTSDDIKTYLDKIKTFENPGNQNQTIEDQSWKKEIIHLSGGKNKGEQELFKSYLKDLAEIAATNKLGANTSSYNKSSTDPIQISQNDQIFNRINAGVSIISFLGHSAVGTFDFSIDNPENYNNFGKYPLMFSLGCYSGNYHTSAIGVGESFCFLKDKGALGFAATTYQGAASVLRDYAAEYYSLLGSSMYGKTVGELFQATNNNVRTPNNLLLNTLADQMTYHGDPAYRINQAPGPDYIIDYSSVKLNPKILTVQSDSFTLAFNITNLGTNIADSIDLRITQKFSNGDEIILRQDRVPATANSNSFSYKLSGQGKKSFGNNTLFIVLDPNTKLSEAPLPAAVTNNQLQQSNGNIGYTFYVTDNAAIPVYPPDFGIVSQLDPILKASTADPLAKPSVYYFQIDTTLKFNSPKFQGTNITSSGGVLTWKPGILLDSTVYYWRISPDSSASGVGTVWSEASFFVRKNSPNGWSQAHFYQWQQNELNNLQASKSNGSYDFIDDIKDIFINNFARRGNSAPAYYINNAFAEINYGNDILAGVYVGVIDPITGLPWVNPKGGKYGSTTPADWRDRKAFPYNTNLPEQRQALIQLLRDTIPDGFYVVFFSIQDETYGYAPQDWAADSIGLGTNIFQVLESQGAEVVRNTVLKPYPYAMAYQKNKQFLGEKLADNLLDFANVSFKLIGNWDEGFLKTPAIGPSTFWKELVWSSKQESSGSDTLSMTIYGLDASKSNPIKLFEIEPGQKQNLTSIDAKQYPYLSLVVDMEDKINKSSPDLEYIRVYYDGVPEFAISPAAALEFYKDTIQQGDIVRLKLGIENISSTNSDSLMVSYVLIDPQQQKTQVLKRQGAISTLSQDLINYTIDTRSLGGAYILEVTANPNIDQPELYDFNNLGSFNFFVDKDRYAPKLDVSFDGIRILDKDLVSASPLILVNLKDENKFIGLQDTSLLRLQLRLQDETSFTPISNQDPRLTFFPANGTGKQNNARCELKLNTLPDGEHEFLVQARDATGNEAGTTDFKLRFNVLNQRTVSSFLPYPNPFSTNMRWVYTLTGEQTPEHVRIRIYTISGVLVREITEQELGPLKVGTHKTDWSWDGRDNYGQLLGNGVYLYQVTIKDNTGKEWEARSTGADAFMKHEMGKLVILR